MKIVVFSEQNILCLAFEVLSYIGLE